MSPSKLDIYRLGLVGNAELAAKDLAASHPDAVFTSGKRSREEQASAMAENILNDGRQWINRTYKASLARDACQSWVTANPLATTKTEIESGLLSILETLSETQLEKLSLHMSGRAFDVRPVPGLSGTMILLTLRNVVHKYGGTLLEKEGGLIRWHAQF